MSVYVKIQRYPFNVITKYGPEIRGSTGVSNAGIFTVAVHPLSRARDKLSRQS